MKTQPGRLGVALGAAVGLIFALGLPAVAGDAEPAAEAPAAEAVVETAPPAAEPVAAAQPAAPAADVGEEAPSVKPASAPAKAAETSQKIAATAPAPNVTNITAQAVGCKIVVRFTLVGGYTYNIRVSDDYVQIGTRDIDAATTKQYEYSFPVERLHYPQVVAGIGVYFSETTTNGYWEDRYLDFGMTSEQIDARVRACRPAALAPKLVAVPARVAPGAKIAFQASGFMPGTATDFFVDNVKVGQQVTNGAGEAVLQWTVPANFPLGAHGVTAVQKVPQPEVTVAAASAAVLAPTELTASAKFEVVGAPTTPPTVPPASTTPPTTTKTTVVTHTVLSKTGTGLAPWLLAGLVLAGLGTAMRLRKA